MFSATTSTTKVNNIKNASETKNIAAPAIGIYWGTFDPPTLAHGNIIEQAIQQLALSKLIIVVNDNTNTGKTYKTPGRDRVAMLRGMLHTTTRGRFIIIRQTDLFALSYDKVKSDYPGKKIVAIVGQDSFEKFGAYCAAYDHVAVVPRGDNSNELKNIIAQFSLTNTSIVNIDNKFLQTSSTIVRQAINDNHASVTAQHLHHTVNDYAHQHGFFKGNYTSQHHIKAVIIQRAWRFFSARRQDAKVDSKNEASTKTDIYANKKIILGKM